MSGGLFTGDGVVTCFPVDKDPSGIGTFGVVVLDVSCVTARTECEDVRSLVVDVLDGVAPGGRPGVGTGVVEPGVDTGDLGAGVEGRDEGRDESSDSTFSRADASSVADNGCEDVDVTEDAGEGGCGSSAERVSVESSTCCETRSTISATGCEWTMATVTGGFDEED